MRSMRRFAFAATTVLFTVFFLFAIAASAAQAQPRETVKALILGSDYFKLDAEVEKRLRAEGIEVLTRRMSEPVSFEMLKLFQVVIVPDFAGLQTPYFVPQQFVVKYFNAKRNLAELQRYVAGGGGLFFSPSMRGGGQEVAEGCGALLAPWGIRVLAAGVRDDAHACCDGEYAWTTNVADSPVSDGVKRIVYPTNMLRWDDAYATVPLVAESAEWQPVVRGMPESVAARGWQYKTWLPIQGQQAPIIAAVRQVEKGRVAAVGISPFYSLWLPFGKPARGWVGESNTGRIDGIFLEKGDQEGPSDGWRLLGNMLKWLARGARSAGMGGYTPERLNRMPAPEPAKMPTWLSGWRQDTGARPLKVLVGARSSFSDGQGTVAEFADAARKAGYSVLVMTETFERFKPESWKAFRSECDAASDRDLVVLAGLDVPDVYQNRYLVFGQRTFPDRHMLSGDGRALKDTQYLSLGFGTHFTAIHRPSSTPMAHQLYKFFAGIVVYTYRKGEMVDDGLLAYEWHVNNMSMPIPLVVHEVYAPEDVEVAASGGHQLFVLADTARNAAWYLGAGMQHFWETPSLFLVTSGPMIRTLMCGAPVVKGNEVPVHTGGTIEVESDEVITDVQLRTHYYAERRWHPGAKRVRLQYQLPPSHLRLCFVYVEDEKGRTAISPVVRFGPTPRHTWRCSDRQNFFGFAAQYTGTILPDLNFQVPAFGTVEGRGLWPRMAGPTRGENLCPLLEFPYASPEVYITDAQLDQRYWRALWLDTVFDAKPSQGTSRSRVYEARVRYYDFNIKDEFRNDTSGAQPLIMKEVTLRLRMPVLPQGPVFPGFTSVQPRPKYGYLDERAGKEVRGKLERGFLDLPVGGYADNLIALTPGIRVDAGGAVGFAAPEWSNGALAVGTSWFGRYVKVPKAQLNELRSAMGLAGKTPYQLKLSRGRLNKIVYLADLQAEGWGVAGQVVPAPKMPYALPLSIEGLNCNWDAAVWRDDGKLDYFGVFEGKGLARLDVTRGGKFYAGNIISATNPAINLTVLDWDASGILLEANNPTLGDVETVVETPDGITGRYRLRHKVTVPAGSSLRLQFGERARPSQ